jgi:hypothetical protein
MGITPRQEINNPGRGIDLSILSFIFAILWVPLYIGFQAITLLFGFGASIERVELKFDQLSVVLLCYIHFHLSPLLMREWTIAKGFKKEGIKYGWEWNITLGRAP